MLYFMAPRRFFRDIEDCDAARMHALDLVDEDDSADLSTYNFSADDFDAEDKRKLAYRYRYIRALYTKYVAMHCMGYVAFAVCGCVCVLCMLCVCVCMPVCERVCAFMYVYMRAFLLVHFCTKMRVRVHARVPVSISKTAVAVPQTQLPAF